MALKSKCPSCGGISFEARLQEAAGYNFQLNFIQCRGCGVVVGVLPFYDPGHFGHENAEAIKKLTAKVDSLQLTLAQVLQSLQRR